MIKNLVSMIVGILQIQVILHLMEIQVIQPDNSGTCDWESAYGIEEISSGTQTWEIKIGNFVNTSCNVFDVVIGIVNLKNNGDTYFWEAQSGVQAYLYNAESGVKHKMTGSSWSNTSSSVSYTHLTLPTKRIV